MEVKVGQVWEHKSSKTKWEVIAIGKVHAILRCGEAESPYSILEMAINMRKISDASDKPSDLEIVQKALEKLHCRIECEEGGYWVVLSSYKGIIFEGETQSLLTWAKQTVGVM